MSVFDEWVEVKNIEKLCDNVAIVDTEVYIKAFDDIRVVELS